ncbi:MAG: DUF4836 family protein, partial [Lewinella sp.]|nr:DUF4836 family protein [Lewinella sp.]
MSHPFRLSLLTVLMAALMWSCTEDFDVNNRALTYLPSDTDAVMVVKTDQLLAKANWATIQSSEPYAEMLEEVAANEPEVAAILRDPAVSGLDMTANAFFAGLVPFSEGRNAKMIMAFPVADATKLAEHIAQLEEGPQTVEGNSWEKGEVSLAWNDEVLLIVRSTEATFTAKQLLEKSSENLSDDKDMQRFLTEDFDLGWWMSSGFIANYLPDEALKMLPGWSREDLKGNYLHGTWRFDEGSMIGELTPVLTRRLAADIDLLFRSETGLDLSEGLPSEGLTGLFTAACDLPGMDQLLLEYMVEGGAREELKNQGVDYEGILASLNGDVMLALYESPLIPEAIFVAGLQDSDRFKEVLANSPMVNAIGDDWYEMLNVSTSYDDEGNEMEPDTSAGSYLRVLEDRFVIAETREAAEQYGQAAEAGPVLSKFRELRPDHRFVAVWNPETILGDDIPENVFGISYAHADDETVVNKWVLKDDSV